MHPADARGGNRSTAPHQRRNAAKCVPNEMARGQKASSSLPQQVEFVKQSIKLRQARQNQPTVKKESPANRKQVQSTIFVMHYNCKIFWCFYSVRLKFNWGLIGFTLWVQPPLWMLVAFVYLWWIHQRTTKKMGKGMKKQNKVCTCLVHAENLWGSVALSNGNH